LVSRHESWIIDHQIDANPITNNDRVTQAKNIMEQIRNNHPQKIKTDLPATVLDYSKLFCTGGSKYLSECLNLENIPNYSHAIWNNMLTIADTPDTVIAWDTEWHKNDFS
jgi:hypothetical protein